MKYIYYFYKYGLLMLIADITKLVKLPNIYGMPLIVIITFNYLAIQYTIKYPLEKRKDITKKELFIPMLIFSSILLTIFMTTNGHSLLSIIVILLANFLELYIMKPKNEKQQEIIDKNINDYFKQK